VTALTYTPKLTQTHTHTLMLGMVRQGQEKRIPWRASAALRGHFPGKKTL